MNTSDIKPMNFSAGNKERRLTLAYGLECDRTVSGRPSELVSVVSGQTVAIGNVQILNRRPIDEKRQIVLNGVYRDNDNKRKTAMLLIRPASAAAASQPQLIGNGYSLQEDGRLGYDFDLFIIR